MVVVNDKSSQMCAEFRRIPFLISGVRNRFRMHKGRIAIVVAVKEDQSPSCEPAPHSAVAGIAVNESVSDGGSDGSDGGDGGDGGGDDAEGGDDDGEPPTHAPMPGAFEWWQISAIAAVLMTSTLLICWIVYRWPARHMLPALLVCFLGSFGICVVCDPRLWYRRMCEMCVAALASFSMLPGLELTGSLPWSGSIGFKIPDPNMSLNITLGALAAMFAVLHFRNDVRK